MAFANGEEPRWWFWRGQRRGDFAISVQDGQGCQVSGSGYAAEARGPQQMGAAHMAIREMGEEEVKLLGTWFSPYVHRVAWVLKLKGIRYEYVEEKINNKSSLLLDCNPVYKKIPVLVHHGKPIVESLFIIEYIDETWKHNPILSTHPYDRAMARFWTLYIDQMKEIKQVSEAMEVLEGMLKGKKFFGGEKIGFLDITFGWIAIWLGAIEEVAGVQLSDPRKYPLLHNWMNRFRELDEIKDSLFPMEKLVRFFQKYRNASKKATK
ncbi:putative glutathione S-transferase [Gossypium australe]|uniref:glutathione transferase n=1 Tax=Gossypium australe TaxID=47621 RepID=A0A5B6UM82_9ROSI|nr:putative glutathione S-transferase [Gossypium australe]